MYDVEHLECSAKTGDNIEELFNQLVDQMLPQGRYTEGVKDTALKLQRNSEVKPLNGKKKRKCCSQ